MSLLRRFRNLFTGKAAPAPPPRPAKPVRAPEARVWWLRAQDCGRTDLQPDWPGLVVDYAPASDDWRPWQAGTRAEFEAHRRSVASRNLPGRVR